MNTNLNPYVGPRTFTENERDRFYGRDREANELLARVLSEQEVVFYAQSGAGKSSLVNTCLIPDLKKNDFEVLQGRVGGDAPAELDVDNIFVFNLLRSLSTGEANLDSLAQYSLAELLVPTPEGRGSKRRALVIDQFEEIFSTHHEDWEKRREFFEQLAQVLEADPRLRVILVMREDYIASLDPYVSILPNRLQARYYMQRLEFEAALKAVKEPVKGGEFSRPYQAGVAEKLVNDLRSVKVYKHDGTVAMEPGQYVEPVQLQVVCYGLWENLPAEGTQITDKDLQEVGDVNHSLGKYYDKRVGEVAQLKNVKERLIREWFEKKLITAGGIRNMVLQESEAKPGELSDNVIRALQSDLIRAEKRGGATWYELTHDRLVEPILERNKVWFSENLNPLQRQAALWNDQARQETWLLSDQGLLEIEQWAQEHPDELTNIEIEFLEECRDKQTEKEHQQELEAKQQKLLAEQKLTRQRRIIANVAVIATIVTLTLAVFGFSQAGNATAQANIAQTERAKSESNLFAANTAQANAEFARATAFANEQEAKRQTLISFSNSLSAQSNALLDENFQISMLLGVEAYKIEPTVQSRGVILNIAQANPRLSQILKGHASDVTSVAFSPNGEIFASGSDDNTIILWDVETLQPVGPPLVGHASVVSSIAFSPNRKTLASIGYDKTILLWDLETHKPIGEPLSGHSNVVTSIAFSPNGLILASGSYDQTIILWDMETRQPIGQPLVGHTNAISSLAFSKNNQTLASGSYDNSIILWDVQTHNLIGQRLTGHTGAVSSVAFSPDGESLASGSCSKLSGDNCIEGEVILWDVRTRQSISPPLIGHTDTVTSVAFSPDQKTLASGSRDKTIILWDVGARQSIGQPLAGHTDAVTSIAFSVNGKTLVSGSDDNAVILWDVEGRQSASRPLTGHSDAVISTAFSPDSRTLASGSWDNTIILWDVEASQPIGQPLTGHSSAVSAVAFSPDGQWLATGSLDTTIRLWDVSNLSTEPIVLQAHEDSISTLAFSPDGQWMATGSLDTTIRLWDVRNFSADPVVLQGHQDSISTLAFSRDTKWLATGSLDATIRLWDVETHQSIGQLLAGHTDAVTSVAFSEDGETLASSSNDQTIILWDVETFQTIGQPLTGHTGAVSSVAFSPDGKTLASSSYDQTIILWDVETHQSIGQPLAGHTDAVTSVAFSPDNKTLASASYDHTIILWDVDLSSLIKKSCQRAGRNFTRAEWQRYFPGEEYRPTCNQWQLESEVIATPVETQTILATVTQTPGSTIITALPGLATPTISVTGTEAVFFRVVNVTDEDRLNIRAGPGLKYEIIGKIPKDGRGIQVTGPGIEADNTIWLPIIYKESSGWVNSFFLSKDNE